MNIYDCMLSITSRKYFCIGLVTHSHELRKVGTLVQLTGVA